jgi:hypothetical protein
MASKKISELTAATLPLDGTELMEVVQGGVNKKVAKSDVATGGGGTVTSVTGTTNRITSTGGATPVIDIDAAYDAAITAQIAAAQVGLWDDRGTFSAAGGAYPSSGGSGTAGAILKGDIWTISTGGTLPTGQVVEIGDTVRALIDTPGNTQANWAILQNNIGFVPENVVNKVTNLTSPDNTKYPTTLAVATEIATKYDFLVTLRTLTASHTLDATDLASVNAGDQLVIRQNVVSDNNMEIPLNATQAFPIGTIIGVRNINTGVVTITGAIGVTLQAPLSAFKLSNQFDMCYIEKVATNTWTANGQLTL